MSRIQYPKLLLLVCSFVLAFLLFEMGIFDALPVLLRGQGYLTMFFGGLLFSFGFTTPFAIAIFIEMADTVDPFLGAIVAGIGAMLSDLIIFQFIRFSFLDELHRLGHTRFISWLWTHAHKESIPEQIRHYIKWSIAGIIIASPLPDELGVTLLSSSADVKGKPFAAFCFLLDAIGVMIVLLTTQSLS
ncbi:hypothetical protein K8942_04050 [Candidatus Peribacteria bacterium]|nr:MAG: hypothetical protein K8942_04050 [Candidatus Peribacteria bacterium]